MNGHAQNGHSAPSALAAVVDFVGEAFARPRAFDEIRKELPPESMVKVGDQLVHVEMAGRGEPLVLVHGFGCSSYSWRRIIPKLARTHRVIAPDLNGFGWTQRPTNPYAYTFDGQASMLLALLDTLGIERFHLAGHSYGGGLSLWLAAHHPARVRTLTLVSSVLPEYDQAQRQGWARFRGLNWLLVHFFVLSRAAMRKGLEESFHDDALVTDELVDEYRRRLLVEGVDDAYYGLMAPFDGGGGEIDLASVGVPTLVLWGACDSMIPVERARPHLSRLPRAHVTTFDACGHAPMEERPDEVAAHLSRFLDLHRERWPERMGTVWRRVARPRPKAQGTKR